MVEPTTHIDLKQDYMAKQYPKLENAEYNEHNDPFGDQNMYKYHDNL